MSYLFAACQIIPHSKVKTTDKRWEKKSKIQTHLVWRGNCSEIITAWQIHVGRHMWYISRGITQAAEWDETSPCTIKHGLFHKMRADSQPANFHVVEARKRIELSSEFYFYTWDQHECTRVRENVQVSTQEYVTITYVHYMTNVIYVAREERTCELCTCGLAWTCMHRVPL